MVSQLYLGETLICDPNKLRELDQHVVWHPDWHAYLQEDNGTPAGRMVCFDGDCDNRQVAKYCHEPPYQPEAIVPPCDSSSLKSYVDGELWKLQNGDLPYRGIDAPLAALVAYDCSRIHTLTLGPIQK